MEEQHNSRIQFSKIRNFNEIIFDTRAFLKANWKTFFLFTAVYAGPILLIQSYNSSEGIQDLVNKLVYNKEITSQISTQKLIIHQIIALIGSIIFNGISFSYIFVYTQNQEITKQSVFAFFNKNLPLFISSTIIAEAIVSISFGIHAILGLVVFIPAQLYIYDRILHKSSLLDSAKRVFLLPLVDKGLSLRSILTSYLILFICSSILIAIAFSLTENVRLSTTILTTITIIGSGFINIVIALLYHSLFIKATNESKL